MHTQVRASSSGQSYGDREGGEPKRGRQGGEAGGRTMSGPVPRTSGAM